ncbi:hypothetical protein C2S52_004403 [Perilla frutescens var. hirtella]|nr:hypothetical protein C2S51_011180 [Perilla frutescens var. frutescens]KAH6793926.1 hypothetical protein C2S52_004403 [Perilla frutescens var. hirtella]
MKKVKRRKQDAMNYGDVFDVSGELAAKPIAPQDAATVESAEIVVLGENPIGGVAAVMKSAAEVNVRRGIVRHDDTTDIVRDKGVVISETTIVGHRIISESIAGQLLGRFAQPTDVKMGDAAPTNGLGD